MIEFELHLESDLHRLLDPVVARPPQPRRRRVSRRMRTRLVTGFAVAALIAAVGFEATLTKSLNPVDWSRSVGQQITNANPASHHQSATPAKHITQASPAPSRPSAGQTPANAPAIPKLSPLPIPTVTPPALPSVP